MREIFQEREKTYQRQAADLKSKSIQLSWLRFMSFVAFIALIIHGVNGGFGLIHSIGVPLALVSFVYFIVKHKNANFQYQIYDTLNALNHNEIKRLSLDINAFDSGESFQDDLHPYSYDLDIFGKHSMFQLVNRGVLDHSKALLAKWFLKGENVDTIKKRQNAVKELSKNMDFTQFLTATANVIFAKGEKEKLEQKLDGLFHWMETETSLKNQGAWKLISYLMGAINTILLVLTVIAPAQLPAMYPYLMISFFLSLGLLAVVFRLTNDLTAKLSTSEHIIATYGTIIHKIEEENFQDQYLNEIKNRLKTDGIKASSAIKKLKKAVFRLNSRASMFYILIDGLFLMDFHLVIAALQWKSRFASHIKDWMEAVHEMESLISLAGFTTQNPDYVFPEFSQNSFHLEGKELGHPLIPLDQSVTNDFSLSGEGTVAIITGSNMSGKSTFERTLGLNIVLAQLGAPVCAASMTLTPTSVFTSMRTKDNLEESTSSFYAELKRIKQLLAHVEDNESTFYVLDEILKGTNSDDRHKGAIALANQLSQKASFGLISTHDLALSELEKENKKIINYSFNSVIEEDDIIFDYKLTQGPCKSFNASKLMQKMGIEID